MLHLLKSGLSVHGYENGKEQLVSIAFSFRETAHGIAQHNATIILDLGHARELIRALTEVVVAHDQKEQ